ncbi:MAG: hypothetical protein M0C28_01780 [Candidatus Moduliflexus flocculans]|nr:hypothetical protein [Candidatus Moduliflexus flocculans]
MDERGENSISVASGANALLVRRGRRGRGRRLRRGRHRPPPARVAARDRRSRGPRGEGEGVPVILNPAPARPLDDGLAPRSSAS